jgi:hypothetical protein
VEIASMQLPYSSNPALFKLMLPHLPQSRICGMRLRVSMHKGAPKKSDFWASPNVVGVPCHDLGSL